MVTKTLFGKYRNSVLGFAWNFISPLIMLLMYYVIFSELHSGGGIENKGVFISVAIFGFYYMTSCIVGGTDAFIGNAALIKKMYIPKEIFVLSKAISSMIVCLIGYSIVLVGMFIIGYPMDWLTISLLPVIIILMFFFGIGCIFFLSSITVYVRDIQYALGPMGIAFFVLTPMRYMATDVDGLLADILWCNPLTYYVESFHYLLYWGTVPPMEYISTCAVISLLFTCTGYLVFRKLKHGFIKRL